MSPETVMKHRGLTDEEIKFIQGGDVHFNIFNAPKGGGEDRCYLLFVPTKGSYYLGHGNEAIYESVVDSIGSDYAILWVADANYNELENFIEVYFGGKLHYRGIEFYARNI